MTVNCKEDLYGTYIENDNGELRNLYLSKCQEFGLSINSACYTTRSALIFAKEDFGRFGNVDHADTVDFISFKYNATKELTLSDLKPVIEWKNGLPPVGSKVMCSYTETDCDGWCDMHGPSDVIAYHGDYVWIAHHGKFNRVHNLCNVEFEKPESPDEKERLEAAYDLYCHVQTVMNKPCSNYDWFLKKGDGNQFDRYLVIVDKTGYRKPN